MKVAFVTLKPIEVNQTGGTEYALAMTEDCCWSLTRKRYLPAGLLACASQMEDAFFFDLSIEPPENLEVLKPDLVVYPLIPYWPTVTKAFHSVMSSICKDVPKIVLAIPPGYMKDYACLEPNPFCVVYSEPEAVFSDFHVTTKDELIEWRAHSKGTAWVEDGVFHKKASLKTCIHEIKGTNWDLVPPSYWFHYQRIVYQISRGCPWRCNFCVWGGSTVTDRTFRMRPAEQVATDLVNLRKTINKYLKLLQPIPVYTLSAQLTTDIKWLKEFHSLMREHPYPFQGNINLHELTEEKLELLIQAGMNGFCAGLEALTDPLLKRMNKPNGFEDIIRSIKILNKADVNYRLTLITGGYGETKDEIKETLDNIEIMNKRGVSHAKIVVGGPIIYYKGTVIAENPPEELVYDPRHAGFRQKHIHVKEWIEVREKLFEYNLIPPDVAFTYPQKRLMDPDS